MIKRLVVVLVVIGILGVGCFFALNSPVLTRYVLAYTIKKHLNGYSLEKFSIGRQQFMDGQRLVFFDVKVGLKSNTEFYNLSAAKIECLVRPRPLRLDLYQVAVESSQIVAPDGEIHAVVFLKGLSLERFEGRAAIPSLQAYQYRLRQVRSDFQGTLKRLTLHDLQADLYQGRVFGEISLDWARHLPYSMDVRFDGVDLRQLKDVNPSYGEVEGMISGSIAINGTVRNFDTIDLKARINKDGKVNASLLKFVTPYIPRTQESAALDEMIRRGEKIPVEIAAMELRSIDTHKISGFVKLLVGTLNLDLNLPIDILYDGNLMSLIEWYQKLKS